MKFCKDCKYFKKEKSYGECYHPNNLSTVTDSVFGEHGNLTQRTIYWCRSSDGRCGPEGKSFDPKPTLARGFKNLFKNLFK